MKIKLKKYGPHSDYVRHIHEIATVMCKVNPNQWNVIWEDGEESWVYESNMIPILKTWKQIIDFQSEN